MICSCAELFVGDGVIVCWEGVICDCFGGGGIVGLMTGCEGKLV